MPQYSTGIGPVPGPPDPLLRCRHDRRGLRQEVEEGANFDDFVREWESDQSYGVPTRVTPSVTDPREILSVGFIDVDPEAFTEQFTKARDPETARHERIDSVIESTTLKSRCEVESEQDFSDESQMFGMLEFPAA